LFIHSSYILRLHIIDPYQQQQQQMITNYPHTSQGLFDVTPPALLSLAITPTLIDVRVSSKMFETSVHVTDDFSGVASVTLKVSGRLGSDQTSLMRAASFQTGSRHDGYWKLKKNIQPLAANGTWRVSSVTIIDLQGNQRDYNTEQINEITSAFVDVFSGLCFTSPWLCADDKDPASEAWLTGYWAMDENTPAFTKGGIGHSMLAGGKGRSSTVTRNVRTLQELVQQDDEQDKKRNWLYEFYRRRWNSTSLAFELKLE